MKLKNKKTGEICELGHIRQAWREEKDGGTGYMFLRADDNNGIIYNSLAEMMDEWEDYKPAEPLIKDEKIRKAVRAWADVLEIDEAEFYGAETWIGFRSRDSRTGWLSKFEVDCFGSDNTLVPFRRYTITELCGEEE